MDRLNRRMCKHLAGQDGDDGLGVDEGGVAQVVQAAGGKDLRTGLPPDGLAEGHAVLGKQLRGQAAQGSEHGPPRVDHLDLAVPAQCFSHVTMSHSLAWCAVVLVTSSMMMDCLLQAGMHACKPGCGEDAVRMEGM